jgi:predicted small secreted protein
MTYNNIPTTTNNDSGASTLLAFDSYYAKPFEIHAGTFNALRGFFEGRGFDVTSAETISVAIMKQAKQGGYNAMEILDSLKGLDSVELSSLVAEIINYGRFKTSYLGYNQGITAFGETARNIRA